MSISGSKAISSLILFTDRIIAGDNGARKITRKAIVKYMIERKKTKIRIGEKRINRSLKTISRKAKSNDIQEATINVVRYIDSTFNKSK